VLVAVVALVAHGRPLAASSGHGGLSSNFWDYTFTSLFLVGVLVVLGLIALVSTARLPGAKWKPPPHTRVLMVLPTLAVMAGITLLLHYVLHRSGLGQQQSGGGGAPTGRRSTSSSGARLRWEEIVVVLGVLLVAGMVFFKATRRRGTGTPPGWTAPVALAAALDESLDDLRADPDLRRAIIAAYARLEATLAATGVPRQPAEAPLEYLERALLALDTSQTSVRRLTDLFEWARFSHHEPEPSMRDEAVDALEAVRDELRAPAEVAA
jgi:hypothetical protein